MPFESVIHILSFMYLKNDFFSTEGKSPKGFSEINCSFNKLLMATKGLVKNLFVPVCFVPNFLLFFCKTNFVRFLIKVMLV